MKDDRPGTASGPAAAGIVALLVQALALASFALPAPIRSQAIDDSGALAPQTTLSVPDDAAPASPAAPIEVVNLTAQAAFTSPAPHAGDSLDYVLTVEWPESGIPVMLLAPDSLSFEGFKVIGQATSHQKLAVPGPSGAVAGLVNRTVFTYKLRAHIPGPGKATSARIRWLTGLSRAEEQRFVPPSHLDVLPAETPLIQRLWFRLLVGWLTLAAAAGLAWGAFRFVTRRQAGAKPADSQASDLRPEAMALKARIRASGAAGASKDILSSMEGLALRHLLKELGSAPEAAAGAKFDAVLDRYLAKGGQGESALADWKSLRELFRHARFAGGHKEPHELQDAWRTLKRCLRITDEPGDE